MAEAQARVLAVQAMNDAVFEVMREGGVYSDLMHVVLDGEGRVSMMQANTARMNELATQAALAVQKNLDAIAEAGVEIPLARRSAAVCWPAAAPSCMSAWCRWARYPRSLSASLPPPASTRPAIAFFCKWTRRCKWSFPRPPRTAAVSAHVPVAESIIVGEVPDSFVDVADTEDMLNLLN